MKKYKNIVKVAVFTALLSACSQQEFTTDQDKFEAFLKSKRISIEDTARVERAKAEYTRRSALATAIYESEKLDKLQLDVEVEEYRKELLISRYFEQYLNESVTEQGVQNYYAENVDNYKTRKAKVAHILFRTTPRTSESERQAVLTKAAEAHSRLTSGEEFAKVAKELSEDKVSGEKGGALGWINEGAVSEGFSNKVFAMKTGDISEPFLSDFGFHIVKVEEEPQDVTKPLAALKGDIRYQLRVKTKKAETQRLLKSVAYETKAKGST